MQKYAKRQTITDESKFSFPIRKGQEITFLNPEGIDIGGFTVDGKSPSLVQNGDIVLADVPGDGHVFYINTNHNGTYQLQLMNLGDYDKSFLVTSGQESVTLSSAHEVIWPSDPLSITWDTDARKDLDVRVIINIVPLAEEHGIFMFYSVTPLAEALEADRLANRNWIQRLIYSKK